MFPDEKPEDQEELKRLEAELASLVPRRDRVDPAWATVLAEMASGDTAVTTTPSAPGAGRPCTHASGHVFACIHCGAGVDSAAVGRRWAWPAAFSAMTAVAAALLVVLVMRPIQPTGELGATADVPQLIAAGGSPRGSRTAGQLTRGAFDSTGGRATRGILTPMAASDPKFFNTLLASNSGPWPSGAAAASGSIGSDEKSLSAGALLRSGWSGRGDLDHLIRSLDNHTEHHSRGAEL